MPMIRVRALRGFYDQRGQRGRDQGEEFDAIPAYADFLIRTGFCEQVETKALTDGPPAHRAMTREKARVK